MLCMMRVCGGHYCYCYSQPVVGLLLIPGVPLPLPGAAIATTASPPCRYSQPPVPHLHVVQLVLHMVVQGVAAVQWYSGQVLEGLHVGVRHRQLRGTSLAHTQAKQALHARATHTTRRVLARSA